MAFDTVNPNTWKGATDYMAKAAADLVSVQEARAPTWERGSSEQTARNGGWRTAISPCKIPDLGRKSVGVAIASRNHVGGRSSIDPKLWPTEAKHRFTLKHVGALCRCGINLGSCYLTCTPGVGDLWNLDLLQLMVGILSIVTGTCALVEETGNPHRRSWRPQVGWSLSAAGWLHPRIVHAGSSHRFLRGIQQSQPCGGGDLHDCR